MCSFSNDPISLWCMEMAKTENGPFILFGIFALIFAAYMVNIWMDSKRDLP